jgi:hypothetical protein
MKRFVVVLTIGGAFLLAVWVAGFIVSTAGWIRAGDRPWPRGLGTLRELEQRHPRHGPSEAALRLQELTRPLGIDFAMKETTDHPSWRMDVAGYVLREQMRATPLIGAPLATVASYVTAHDQNLDAIRDHLLGSGEEIRWTVNLEAGPGAPGPDLAAHTDLAKRMRSAPAPESRSRHGRRAATDRGHSRATSCRSLTIPTRPRLHTCHCRSAV